MKQKQQLERQQQQMLKNMHQTYNPALIHHHPQGMPHDEPKSDTASVPTSQVSFSYLTPLLGTRICSISRDHDDRIIVGFVSDLLQVSGFLRVLQFPPPIKLTVMI